MVSKKLDDLDLLRDGTFFRFFKFNLGPDMDEQLSEFVSLSIRDESGFRNLLENDDEVDGDLVLPEVLVHNDVGVRSFIFIFGFFFKLLMELSLNTLLLLRCAPQMPAPPPIPFALNDFSSGMIDVALQKVMLCSWSPK